MAHREGTEMKSGTQDQRSKALSWLLSSCIRKRHMGHSLSPGSWRAWSHMQSVQHTSGSVCACQPGTKGLLCPALCHAGIETVLDHCTLTHKHQVQMQSLCLLKIPVNSPFTSCYVAGEVETVGKKGASGTASGSWIRALQQHFPWKLLFYICWHVIWSLLLWKAHREDFSTTLERGGREWADCWHWNISSHPAGLNSNKVWGCKIVLDSIHFLNSWAGPSLCLSLIWKPSFFPCSSFYCWFQISCCQF